MAVYQSGRNAGQYHTYIYIYAHTDMHAHTHSHRIDGPWISRVGKQGNAIHIYTHTHTDMHARTHTHRIDGPWISQVGKQGRTPGIEGGKYAEEAENAICQVNFAMYVSIYPVCMYTQVEHHV
jgi:hypothetical protein